METLKSYWSLLDVSITLAGSRAKILTPCWSYSRPCLVEWESLCRLEPSTNIQDCISTQMENLMRFVSVEKSFDVYHYRRRVLFVLAYYIRKCISGFLVFQSALFSGFRGRLITEFDVPSRLRCSHSDAKVSRSRYRRP